ncbi:MAG TPA: ATP-binding protein, partial [Chloroflexota bacterium]|nr:ATP-binding protein [Chloroflexota bacterium]
MSTLTQNGSFGETLFDLPAPNAGSFGRQLDGLAAKIDRSRPGAAGYVMRRLLLVNYWHFDEEEIVVPHGRLFLLGENGSGKSTILGATIPMLLDGSIRPERLDTFGSSQRKIDHYVLGQRAGGAVHQRRTSYVALEFAWCDPNAPPDDEPDPTLRDDLGAPPRFLTIGICLAGNADAQETVRAYRFVITSGARLGIDILLKDRQGRVYDASYFRNQAREHGVITERQSEYRDLVARYLFGYANPRTLDHLVEVLLLLRRPGLSNEIHTFADVYEYLKRALPALPDEITDQTTEAFARIDELRHSEARLQRQADACAQIHAADLALTRARARQRALPVVLAENSLRRRQVEVSEKERGLAVAEAERAQTEARHVTVERELTSTRQLLGELEGSALAQEAAELEQRARHLETEHDLLGQVLAGHQRTLDDRRRDQTELNRRLTDREHVWRERHARVTRSGQVLASLATEGRWSDGEKAITRLVALLARHGLEMAPSQTTGESVLTNVTTHSSADARLASADLDQVSGPTDGTPDGLAGWLEAHFLPRLERRHARLEALATEVAA